MATVRDRLGGRPGRAVPAVVYALVVFVASVADPPPGGLPPSGPLGLVAVDKWIHVGTYAVLTVLVVVAFGAVTRRSVAVTATISTAYGVGIELVQATLPYRGFSPLDVLANELGIVLGLAVVWAAARYRSARADG